MLHMASSDEEDPLAASSGIGGSSGVGTTSTNASAAALSTSNHLGANEILEDEGLYQFRRSKSCQYHKVSASFIKKKKTYS